MKRAAPPRASAHAASCHGLVVASHGRHCIVEDEQGQRVLCHPRGKKLATVVGDTVRWLPSGGEGVIEHILPRRNLLYRQDDVRTKSFAANLDQALILLAAEPVFSEQQLARALIACEAGQITPLIALNKADLTAAFATAWQRLAPYRDMGYDVLPLAIDPQAAAGATGAEALPDVEALSQRLCGRVTLILGPSGAGKSTLINRLAPGAAAQTGAISQALNSGRHTTTSTTWYWLDRQRHSALIDSPGFQEFGLHHIDPMHLAGYMPDIGRHADGCRFYNCTHLHEPGCAVRAAIQPADQPPAPGQIHPHRHRLYGELFSQLRQAARA